MKTQIWIAVSIHVLVAIARKRLGLEKSLYQILQIFSITSLEKVPILQVFEAFDSQSELLDNSNQLILFGLYPDISDAIPMARTNCECAGAVVRCNALLRIYLRAHLTKAGHDAAVASW